MKSIPLLLAGVLFASSAVAQSSADFRIEAQAFNAGGHPAAGTTLASAGFELSLDALGDGATALSLASASFRMGGGLPVSFPPPGEVAPACIGTPASCLAFTSQTVLTWPPERSTGVYNLYRGLLSSLSGLGFGACEQLDVPNETATDADPLSAGAGFFYLVTAENRLAEEGTKGFRSNGIERANAAPCP
jgi:hypothetical protein